MDSKPKKLTATQQADYDLRNQGLAPLVFKGKQPIAPLRDLLYTACMGDLRITLYKAKKGYLLVFTGSEVTQVLYTKKQMKDFCMTRGNAQHYRLLLDGIEKEEKTHG